MRRDVLPLVPIVLLLALTGCPADDELSYSEAAQALDEASLAGQASDVAAGTVEISTNFTIGGMVEAAAAELRDFIASQLPCAEIALVGATLTIVYGAKAGNCTYAGQTYSGTHTVTVSRNHPGDVLVQHTWTDLSNGRVEVSGSADVTWSVANGTRRVVHDLAWTRLRDGKTGHGTGDRTQGALPGGILEGISVDGTCSWTGAAGTWGLDIDGVEARWVDPVPQAGAYVLTTPSLKTLTLSFARVDADTIRVTVSGGARDYQFDVSRTGTL
ncbi:MAG: hypothetical protein HY906_27095 [Deltaproteobacteria bacterium]|nr:hypothetical protein [Deltaproteobacteria bacterium]